MRSLKVKMTKGNTKRFKLNIVEPPLKKADYVIFFILTVICFVLFHIEGNTFGTFMINQFLPFIIYLVCGWLVYKTAADAIGMGSGKAKICAYAYLTMPIGFYSQFILWQAADVFTVAFVLLGFYFWVKDNDLLFILLFGIAAMFNALALPMFVTLLVLKEKVIWRTAISIFIAVIPMAIMAFIHALNEPDVKYLEGFLGTGYDTVGIMTGMTDVSLAVLLCVVVVACAYFKNITLKEERIKWALYFLGLIMFAVFGLGRWEPEWLLVMAPFMTLGAFIHSDTKFFISLELILMLCLEGIFVFDNINIVLSIYVVVLLIMAIFKHPTYSPGGFRNPVNKEAINSIRIRFVGSVTILIIPAVAELIKGIMS